MSWYCRLPGPNLHYHFVNFINIMKSRCGLQLFPASQHLSLALPYCVHFDIPCWDRGAEHLMKTGCWTLINWDHPVQHIQLWAWALWLGMRDVGIGSVVSAPNGAKPMQLGEQGMVVLPASVSELELPPARFFSLYSSYSPVHEIGRDSEWDLCHSQLKYWTLTFSQMLDLENITNVGLWHFHKCWT